DPPLAIGTVEHVRRVHRARGERLLGCELELRRCQRADERKALAEGAAGVEVRRERDRRTGVDERATTWHGAAEEERARRQQDTSDLALGARRSALLPGCLEVVDGARPQLDRERDRARLRELVSV